MEKEKNIKAINVIIALFIIAGVAVLLYPFMGFWLSHRSESYAIQEYDTRYEEMESEARQVEWNKALQYNDKLQPGAIADPFTSSPAGTEDDYLNVLNIGAEGMMGYLQIPKINLRLPIYHGTTEAVLESGVGHLEGSHIPVGGAGTHAVLTGHTGLESSKLFTNLTELKENDEFYIYVLDQVLAYRIDRISVVLPTETKGLETIPGEDHITLITCTPYGINSHRLLIRGTRVDYTPDEVKEKIASTKGTIDWMTAVLIGVGVVFFLIIAITIRGIINRCRKN